MATQAFIIATEHRIVEAIEAVQVEVGHNGPVHAVYSENSDLWGALSVQCDLLVALIKLYRPPVTR